MKHEMSIPKSRAAVIFEFVITVAAIFFVLLAIVNLCNGVGLIASCLWLALVTAVIWNGCKVEGGWRRFLINRLGELCGRRFVEADPAEAQPGSIRFGFQLLGHRFIQQSISLNRIESVEWSTGQATSMAGRDMNDWHVWVWFHPDDPKAGEIQREGRRPKSDRDLVGVGPSTPKDRAEALGLALVAFLREAGADLVPGAIPTCFVRRERAGEEVKNIQSDAAPNGGPATPPGNAGGADGPCSVNLDH